MLIMNMLEDKKSGWKKNVGQNEKLKTKEQVEKEEVKKMEMSKYEEDNKRGGDRYGGQRDNRGGRKEYNEKPSQQVYMKKQDSAMSEDNHPRSPKGGKGGKGNNQRKGGAGGKYPRKEEGGGNHRTVK